MGEETGPSNIMFIVCTSLSQGNYDHCHYQGTIRGLNDSRVVLNTCSGLR